MSTSRKLTFPYLSIPKRDPKTKEIIGDVYYPVVPIRVSYGHKLGRAFHALIDSGAGRNLFPAELGEMVGINIKKGKISEILGIGGVVIKGFSYKIKIYVGTRSFRTMADFSYEQQVPLLGREGFFDLFDKILFKQKERIVELEV